MSVTDRGIYRVRPLGLALVVLCIPHVLPPPAGHAQPPSQLPSQLRTRWADEVTPENVLPEYPRPQLRRAEWWNLNGEWDYAIRPDDQDAPEQYDGKILVPFAIESQLSGVRKYVAYGEILWYRRTFDAPKVEPGERLLLNFGAVDWQSDVWVNGTKIGRHQGGYDPFTYDITAAVTQGQNELVVAVWDPTDAGSQPRGKQLRRPHGIWYTSVTGIWQTVWLEKTPASYISSLKITPRVAESSVQVVADGPSDDEVTVEVRYDGKEIASVNTHTGRPVEIPIPDPKLWSPSDPALYDLLITTKGGDRVESYFGLRSISIVKNDRGVNRIALNGAPLFQYGVLDQGWWPDGLYTAPTDEALQYDLRVAKRLGFNMVRKHVKVEPARWYYWCDKIGLMVWQDMPSGDRYIGGAEPDILRTESSADDFERELRSMVRSLYNHPSIVMWIPYNEGWGQWDTARVCRKLSEWDSTRLLDNASGWIDRGIGDVRDIHRYPGPAAPAREDYRAGVLGEFGGIGLEVPGHTWKQEHNWNYVPAATKAELVDKYRKLVAELRYLVSEGLAAAVYTQISDVEVELTGILTYDRKICKLPQDVAALHKLLYQPTHDMVDLVSTSEVDPQVWRYTMTKPSGDWYKPTFDDAKWREGLGGFGADTMEIAAPRSLWTTDDIWIRRTADISGKAFSRPMLRIFHDEDATVYIEGKKVASLVGYSTAYTHVPLSEETVDLLRKGPVKIAVHCHQSFGGQFIDVGIVDLKTQAPERDR